MTTFTPAVTSAILSGSAYTPSLSGTSASTSSSLLASLGNTSLGGAGSNILSSAYQSLSPEALTAQFSDNLDSLSLSAILQNTNYSTNTSLFSSLTATNFYQDTLTMLNNSFNFSLDVEG
ncbi:MAG: hypothetical protein COY40_02900 [Alphaproteobacteria bacterium CG_4_10_14_0_8_um_filter_53_9]|nr:MAG: hypothetical protein COY40_02900 [Alphaproteobacteria bacterium CG_4_10_14_0_8_um_filter_53_9]